MTTSQHTVFCSKQSHLHELDMYDCYQVNLSKGPLVTDSLRLLFSEFSQASMHFERMTIFPICLRLPINFEMNRAELIAELFNVVFKQIALKADAKNKLNELWKGIIESGFYCFWGTDDRSEQIKRVRVNLLLDTKSYLSSETYSHFVSAMRLLISQSYGDIIEMSVNEATDLCIWPIAHTSLVDRSAKGYDEQLRMYFYLLSEMVRKPMLSLESDCFHFGVLHQQAVAKARKEIDVMFTSARTGEKQQDRWQTPQAIFSQLNDEFHFTLDAAAESTTALCPAYFTEQDDALTQSWESQVVFCNPPYSKLKAFARKAYEESLKGVTVVMLVPARTDTQAFHHYLSKGEVRFIKGRLKFLQQGKVQNTAPFPSMVCVLGGRVEKKMFTVQQGSLSRPIE